MNGTFEIIFDATLYILMPFSGQQQQQQPPLPPRQQPREYPGKEAFKMFSIESNFNDTEHIQEKKSSIKVILYEF